MKSLLTLWFFIASCCSCFSQGLEDWAEPNNRFFLQVEAFEIDTNTLTELTFDQKLSNKSLYKNVQQLVKEKKAKLRSSTGEYLTLEKTNLNKTNHEIVYPTEWDPCEEHPEIILKNGVKITGRYIIPSMPVCFESRPLGSHSEFTLIPTSPDLDGCSIEAELDNPSYILEVELKQTLLLGHSTHANYITPIASPMFSNTQVKTQLRIRIDKPQLLSISSPKGCNSIDDSNSHIVHFVKLHQLPEVGNRKISPSANLSVEVEWIQMPTSSFVQLSENCFSNSHKIRHTIQKLINEESATLIDSSITSRSLSSKKRYSVKKSAQQYIYPTEYEPCKFDYHNRPTWEDHIKFMEARGYWSYPLTYMHENFEERPLGVYMELATSTQNDMLHIELETDRTSLTQTDILTKFSYKEGSADITFPRVFNERFRKSFSIQENQYQLLNYSHPVLPDGTIDPTQTIAIFARAIITPTQ